jgi:hypothetical protein
LTSSSWPCRPSPGETRLVIQNATATAADPVSYREFPGREHGTNLLSAHDGLDATITSGWLLNHLAPER